MSAERRSAELEQRERAAMVRTLDVLIAVLEGLARWQAEHPTEREAEPTVWERWRGAA